MPDTAKAVNAEESGWTLQTFKVYTDALRDADGRFAAERDRRYTEVSQEREKALKIKEEADKAALGLAREIQTYKDEKANELRSQIERERGSYVTQQELRQTVEKLEAVLKPLSEYVTSQQGRASQVVERQTSTVNIWGIAGIILGTLIGIGGLIAALLAK